MSTNLLQPVTTGLDVRNRFLKLLLVWLGLIICAPLSPTRAASPLSDTLRPTATAPVTWIGTATGPVSASSVASCREGSECDTFILTFDGSQADWAGKIARITINWQSPTTNYDLYLLRESLGGPYVVAQSTTGPPMTNGIHEVIDFSPGAFGTGRYLVRVMYTAGSFQDQYSGSAAVVSTESSCRLPGLTVLEDQRGDAADAQANHDIERVSVAEPYMIGTSKLVFTIKLASLESLSTQTSWRVYFRTPNAVGTRYFVEMKTDAALTADRSIVNVVSYKYGIEGTTLGDADDGRYDPQTGTITITVAHNKVGNPQPNQYPAQKLEQMYAQVIVGALAVDSAPNRDFDLSQASYTVVGNASCNPGKLAFISNIDGNNEVYVMDADGRNPVNMTYHSATEYSPSWSPDGKKLTYASSRAGSHDIFVIDAQGGSPTNLTNIPGSDLDPAWSPDGKLIAFASWRDTGLVSGTPQIFVMNASGTNQVALTSGSNYYRHPTWSPDGKKLLFWGGPNAAPSQIYTINANGTEMVAVTNDGFHNTHSAWSPDGTRIAFSSNRDGNQEIYVMNSDGSNIKRLTYNASIDVSPAWSPDGLLLAFTSFRDGNGEIYVMNADGSNQTRLTGSSTSEDSPAWQPNFTPTIGTPAPSVVLTKSSDFDGDNKDDLALWRDSNATWYILNSSNNSSRIQPRGDNGDVPVPGDYDGDGKTDLAVITPSNGVWQILLSQSGALRIMPMGQRGDVPVPGDYDGDGKTDIAFYRPGAAKWYVMQSSDNAVRVQEWGTSFDRLVPGDYDGDGKTDLAVFRPANGVWYILKSSGGTQTQAWGLYGDVPVPADYDGDGRTDIAVFRPNEANWYIINSSSGSGGLLNMGGESGDQLVPGDYDGDGKADAALWKPADGKWRIRKSSDGLTSTQFWGQNGDIPLRYLGAL